MQQSYDFKEISALLDEINNLMDRFKGFVSKISSVEVLASNFELELLTFLEKLEKILSSNASQIRDSEKESNIKKGMCNANEPSMGQVGSSAELTPSPAGHHEEMVRLYNLFQGMGKRCSDLANRINSIDGAASNLYSALGGIQKRLKNLINRELFPLDETGMFSIPLNMEKIPKYLADLLEWSAEMGVVSFSAKRLANDRAVFEIEGRKLTLSPRLADLLVVLSKDHGSSEGKLVSWKTLDEIAQLVFGPKRGLPFKNQAERERLQHSIVQSISLLRKEFKAAGINPYLIQRNPELGYRFALRRAPGESQ